MFLLHGVALRDIVILIIFPKECKLHVRITFIFILLKFCNFLSLTSNYSSITFHRKPWCRSYGWERQCACIVRCGSGLSQPFSSSRAALQSHVTQSHLFTSYDSCLYTLRISARGISLSQGLYEHATEQTQKAQKHTSMPRVKI